MTRITRNTVIELLCEILLVLVCFPRFGCATIRMLSVEHDKPWYLMAILGCTWARVVAQCTEQSRILHVGVE